MSVLSNDENSPGWIGGSSSSSNDRDETVARRPLGQFNFVPAAAWRSIPGQRPLIGASTVFRPAALPSRSRTRRLRRRAMASLSSSASPPPRTLGQNRTQTLMQTLPHSTGQHPTISPTFTSPASPEIGSHGSHGSNGSPSIAARYEKRSTADGADSSSSSTRRTHLQAEITILATLKHPGVGSGRTHGQNNTVFHATLERPGEASAGSGSGSGARVTIDAVVEACDPTAGAGNAHRTIRTVRLAGKADWKAEGTVFVLPKSTASRQEIGSAITASRRPASTGNAPGSIHQQPGSVSQRGLESPWPAGRAAFPARQNLILATHPAASHGNGQSRSVESLVGTGGPVPVTPFTSIASSPVPQPVSSQISQPFSTSVSFTVPSPASPQSRRTSFRPATHFQDQIVTFRRYPHHAATPFMVTTLPGSPGAFGGMIFPQPGCVPPSYIVQGPVPFQTPTGAFYRVAPPSFTRHGMLQGLSWYLFTSSPFAASYPVLISRSDVGFPVPRGHNVRHPLRTGVPQIGGLRCPSQAPASVPQQPPDANDHVDHGLYIDTTLLIVLDDTFTMPVRVTFSARVVDDWISQQSAQEKKFLGFDLEWRPNQTRGDDNKVAVIQLSGPRGCLIIQLLYMKSVPESLKKLLADVNVKLAGVGVMADFQKLYRDYGVVCTGAVELGFLASYVLGKGHLRHVGLAELSGQALQLQTRFVKNKRVTLSDWAARNLSRDQIKYAAADAFVAYRLLLVLKEKISLRGLPDFYGLCL